MAGSSVPDNRNYMRKRRMAAAVSAAVMTSALPGSAFGQVLEEVIVTATKRSESVMDVPLAISAVSGQLIREANLDDVKDLISYTPGVTGNSQDSFIDFVSVRGILTNDFGIGGDPSIGLYKNGLYQGRNGSAVTSLYDIERAEVLRGPQGFLFGRGAISGAMNIHTTRPDTEGVNGYAELNVGERDRLIAEGAINVPVGDHLAFRLAGYHSQQDGYVDNAFPGRNSDYISHNKDAVRLSTLFETDRLTVNLMLEYENRNLSGSIYVPTAKGDGYELLSEIYGDLGYPTANVRPWGGSTPLEGVFAVQARVGVGAWRDGVASVGTRPAVGGGEPLVEVHLFDFDGDLYGKALETRFVRRLRGERDFPGLEALVEQMKNDESEARSVLATASAE